MSRAILVLVLAAGVAGCQPFQRSVEIFSRAAHIAGHWDELRAEDGEMCAHPFCTRTDTVQKRVGGRAGYSSETTYDYCPVHNPNFIDTGSKIDGLFRIVHFGLAFFLSLFVASIAFGVVLFPFCLIVAAIRRSERIPGEASEWAIAGGCIIGFPATFAAWILFFLF